MPPVRMNWAGEPKLECQKAWITQLDDWKRIRMVWEQTLTATFKNPTTCEAFPFDWQKYKFQVWLEPSISLPTGMLRGTVYEDDPLRMNRKAELLAVSMNSDPVFPIWSYYNDEQETIVRTSSFCSDNTFVPEWEFFTYRDLDREGTSSWPYWLATQTNNSTGFNTRLSFTLWARRRPGFYVSNILSFVVLTECMVLFSFVSSDLHTRRSWNALLLLVLFVLKFASTNAVPRVPNLTMYDKKHMSAWVLTFVVTTMQHLSVVVHGLNFIPEVVDHFESVCVIIAITWFLAENVWYWTVAYFLTCPPTEGLGKLDDLMRSFGNEARSESSLCQPLMNTGQTEDLHSFPINLRTCSVQSGASVMQGNLTMTPESWGNNPVEKMPTHRSRGLKA